MAHDRIHFVAGPVILEADIHCLVRCEVYRISLDELSIEIEFELIVAEDGASDSLSEIPFP